MTLITHQFSVSNTTAVAYCSIDSLDRQSELTAKEKGILDSRSSEKAKLSFLAGRLAAHEALQAHGMYKEVLVMESSGQRLAPSWPEECSGSIAHTAMKNKRHAAVAAVSANCSLIGIDIEPLARVVQPPLLNKITSKQERERLPVSRSQQTTLEVFCIKEALFKAIWPVVKRSLSFSDATIDYHASTITLSSSLSAHPVLNINRFVYQSIQYEDTLITLVSTLAM